MVAASVQDAAQTSGGIEEPTAWVVMVLHPDLPSETTSYFEANLAPQVDTILGAPRVNISFHDLGIPGGGISADLILFLHPWNASLEVWNKALVAYSAAGCFVADFAVSDGNKSELLARLAKTIAAQAQRRSGRVTVASAPGQANSPEYYLLQVINRVAELARRLYKDNERTGLAKAALIGTAQQLGISTSQLSHYSSLELVLWLQQQLVRGLKVGTLDGTKVVVELNALLIALAPALATAD